MIITTLVAHNNTAHNETFTEVLIMLNEKVINGLQIIVTDLSQQADGHALQSRIFAAEGFTKLAAKYAEHAVEERGWVEKCTDRLIDLGVDVKLEAKKETPVYKDPVEWIKYDLEVSKAGLAWLHEITEAAREDYTTFDILKAYYQDEEGDVYWAEAQLEVIDCIGKQNWILQQL